METHCKCCGQLLREIPEPVEPQRDRRPAPRGNRAIVEQIRIETGISKREVRLVIFALTKIIREELMKGHKVMLWKLGTFILRYRKARIRPPTVKVHGQSLPPVLQATVYPKFTADAALKRELRSLDPEPFKKPEGKLYKSTWQKLITHYEKKLAAQSDESPASPPQV